MVYIKCINNKSNPIIKDAIKLAHSSDRKQAGCFLIDGYREILRAINNNFVVERVFFNSIEHTDKEVLELLEEIKRLQIELITCSDEVMTALGCRKKPSLCVAVAKSVYSSLEEVFNASSHKNPLYIIVEGLEKPGNLGAILRSVDASGASGVILCNCKTDIFNPNVIRSSLGTIFSVPICTTSNEAVLSFFNSKNIDVYVTSPSAKNLYSECNFTLPTALVVGSESDGVSAFWVEKCINKIVLPMNGCADSLNVAMTVSICLYEALRQRSSLS